MSYRPELIVNTRKNKKNPPTIRIGKKNNSSKKTPNNTTTHSSNKTLGFDRIWNIMSNILMVSMLILLAVVFFQANGYKLNSMLGPEVLGRYRISEVLSDSMSPNFVEGDLIVTKRIDTEKYKMGDHILYLTGFTGSGIKEVEADPDKYLDEDEKQSAVTHGLHEIIYDESGKIEAFKSMGSATGSVDPNPIRPEMVAGKRILTIPKFFTIMKLKFGAIPIGYVIIFGIALIFAIVVPKIIKKILETIYNLITKNKKTTNK